LTAPPLARWICRIAGPLNALNGVQAAGT